MKLMVVVKDEKDWPQIDANVEVLVAKNYLSNSEISIDRHIKVLNLCRSYRYQSIGYYVSLLAEARGHKPLPSVQTISDLKSPSMTRFVSDELDELIQDSLKHLKGSEFTIAIYFGKNMVKTYDRLSSHLFTMFQTPLLQVNLHKMKTKWSIQSVQPMIPSEIPKEHWLFFKKMAREYFSGKRVTPKKKKAQKYDLAILCNSDDRIAPSDKRAIQKFIKAGERVGFSCETITKDDYNRLAEFDALFIRETTSVNHHTFRFARRAEAEGLVSIDDSESILKCSNKVYLSELMQRHKIPTPKTLILQRENLEDVKKYLGFPCVLKQPDSSFSNGVTKIDSEEHLLQEIPNLLDKSDLLIAQAFIPTAFDWRITIFDKTPLFACKYYMSRRHWQIYEKTNSGKLLSGRHETLAVGQAPKKIVSVALKAANLIGNGFYGVDIKECGEEVYVIEINDNPSIDSGVEDSILQDELYLKIMSGMMNRVESKKMWRP